MANKDKIKGCLFGAAFGDAMAKDKEFMSFTEIATSQPDKAFDLPSPLALVTDDTQMMLALLDGLQSVVGKMLSTAEIQQVFAKEFLKWKNSATSGRNPSMACLSSLCKIEAGYDIEQAVDYNTKGCGANMRVMPIGLLDCEGSHISGLAQQQALVTHGHPTALAASDLTARAVQLAYEDYNSVDMANMLISHALAMQTVYAEDWLAQAYKFAGYSNGSAYIAKGWGECQTMLVKLARAVAYNTLTPIEDICEHMGEGWSAEEALGCALLAYFMHPCEPIKAIRLATACNGNSSSIACITGAIAGATWGSESWPKDWYSRIEQESRISHNVDMLYELCEPCPVGIVLSPLRIDFKR